MKPKFFKVLFFTFLLCFSIPSLNAQRLSEGIAKSSIPVLVDGALLSDAMTRFQENLIESVHVYKDKTMLPKDLEMFSELMQWGLIAITLLKPIEYEHPVSLGTLLLLNGLSKEDRIQLGDKWIQNKKILIYPSSFQNIKVGEDKQGKYLQVQLK